MMNFGSFVNGLDMRDVMGVTSAVGVVSAVCLDMMYKWYRVDQSTGIHCYLYGTEVK